MSIVLPGIPDLIRKARQLDAELRKVRSAGDGFSERAVIAQRLQNQALLLGFLTQYYEEREGPITECLSVVCVLKFGGRYVVDDVLRLHDMCTRNLYFNEFICLTDVPEVAALEDVRVMELQHGWKGWWSKIELFAQKFNAGERMLYFDLDTVIVDRLDDIADREEHWLMLGDFYRRPPRQAKIGLASGMMMWTANDQFDIYQAFSRQARSLMQTMRGDQDWIAKKNPGATLWEAVVPGQVVSYKVHCKGGEYPKGTRVVCFHGDPKPRDVSDPWVLQHWRANE